MSPAGGFSFGPYRLDVRPRRLIRDGAPIALSDRQFDVLHALLSRPGELVTKDVLVMAAWKGAAVGDGSLTQVIFQLRQLLDAANRDRYIKGAKPLGYRFVAPVEHVVVRHTDEELAAIFVPHRAMMDGRAALETLELDAIARARATFQSLLAHHADEARVHVGLANACVLQFESTRADPTPDAESLRLAATHAREACRLDVDYGEAWATLGFVVQRTGDRMDALAALRHSVTLEPDNWRHWLRLCFASWGEERLRAARRTLALLPECPPARLLAATVFVARGALDLAERELDAGLAAMPGAGGSSSSARLSFVGLYWLKGLLCLARGANAAADAMFEKELAIDARGHMYAREMAANTWYALGVVCLRRGEEALAREAFDQVIARVPNHLMARAGLALLEGTEERPNVGPECADLKVRTSVDSPTTTGPMAPQGSGSLAHPPRIEIPLPASPSPLSVDAAVARAIRLVAAGDAAGAAQLVGDALTSAPTGSAGWLIPIEPLLGIPREPAAWAAVLAALTMRAS